LLPPGFLAGLSVFHEPLHTVVLKEMVKRGIVEGISRETEKVGSAGAI
jgi:hypothetical protein